MKDKTKVQKYIKFESQVQLNPMTYIEVLTHYQSENSHHVKVQMKCFFLLPNLKEQQKSGRSPFAISRYLL